MSPESNIPVLKLELPMSNQNEQQGHVDELSRKLYNDAQSAIVKLSTDKGRPGSGFLVEDGTHLLTSARNVVGSKEQFAVAADGKRYRLEIEKLDDLNDLALLKIKNGKIPGTTALPLGETKAISEDMKVWALSIPQDSSKPYLSPGYVRGVNTPIDFIGGADDSAAEVLAEKIMGKDRASAEDATVYLSQLLLEGKIHLEPGSIGAPVLDEHGKVVSVAVLSNRLDTPKGETLALPVESAQSLLSEKGKFEFKYSAHAAAWAESLQSNLKDNKLGLAVETGIAAGGSYLGYRAAGRYPLVASALVGSYGLTRLSADANHYLQSTERADSWKFGLAAASDLGTVTGAALMLTESMRGRGMLLAGLGIAGRAATDFIRNRWVLDETTRTEGDKTRKPFSLDELLKP